MFRKSKTPSATPIPAKPLASLPPDLLIRIVQYLPVPDLPQLARASRRFKVLVASDGVYEHKLALLSPQRLTTKSSTTDLETANELRASLAAKLKQLPGGHLLPGSGKYLEQGSYWATTGPENPLVDVTDPKSSEELFDQSVLAPMNKDSTLLSLQSLNLQLELNLKSQEEQKTGEMIPQQEGTSLIPNPNITIGAGGLKASQRKGNDVPASVGIKRGSGQVSPFPGFSKREAFKQVYTELLPYYLDFRVGQKDTKVLRDFTDVIDLATMLNRLRLFGNAKFLTGSDDLHFALETTIEWFESTVLGEFETAYDKHDIKEMRKFALASYNLNGGAGAVNIFIAKNPIFFDHTFNPSLVASMLPSTGGPAVGYALADEFAKYMDHMLTNCKKQAELVASVFVPEVDALTVFVNKVFEDSIAEYLSAVLVAAKKREGLGIFLHTLATSVYCCTQFMDYIAKNPYGVKVDAGRLRTSISNILKPYTDSYLTKEIEHMTRKLNAELEKWNKRKKEGGDALTPVAGSAILTDKVKMQAHKRMVMDTMKAIMFAPMELTRTLVMSGFSTAKTKSQDEPLIEKSEDEPLSPLYDDEEKKPVTYHLDDSSLGALVSLELCLNLMHTNKESLGRTLVITSATNSDMMCVNVQKIFCPLLDAIGEKHIKPAFDNAADKLSKSVPLDVNTSEKLVNQDSLQYFELVHIADLVQQMLEAYYVEDIKSWIDDQDFLSDIVVERKAFERLLDDSVAHGMDRTIQVLINQVEFILLSLQKPTDYNPPGTGVLDVKPTKACTKAIECIQAHGELLSEVAEKHTLEVFFSEVGVRLFNVICKNLKRMQISQTGSLQLLCDLNRYCEWANSLRISSVSKLFMVLKELGSLFLADGGEELRKQVHDLPRFQGVLRVEELYELLASRTDYKKIQKYVETKECIVM